MPPTYDRRSDPAWDSHERNLRLNEEEAQRVRRWKTVSSALRTLSVVAILAAAGVQLYAYKFKQILKPAPAVNVEGVKAELDAAHRALLDVLSRADGVAANVVETARKQQQEIAVLRARYDSLKALTAGQEDLARSYRAILTDRTWTDRILDAVSGFLLGVASSLAATWLWLRFYRSTQPESEQAPKT